MNEIDFDTSDDHLIVLDPKSKKMFITNFFWPSMNDTFLFNKDKNVLWTNCDVEYFNLDYDHELGDDIVIENSDNCTVFVNWNLNKINKRKIVKIMLKGDKYE